jgi:iron(III) transport system substrate-binding protein
MKDWVTWAVVLGAMLLVVGVPFALRPAQPANITSDASQSLVIITPHNEQIRKELSDGFNRFRRSQGKDAVKFDWRSSGGTSDLRKQVLSELSFAAEGGRENEGIGYDLFFGGGDFEFGLLAKGITIKRDGKDVKIPALVAVDLSDDFIHEVFPTPDIGGVPLYEPKKLWMGAVLSSFGIIYNRDVLKAKNLPEPTTWSDLTGPALRQSIALADPSHSGSIAAAYNVILRRNGWTGGWALLRRAFGNGRYFTSSAGKVPVDVSAGEAAMGMCIDFYGRYQAGAIGGNRVGYVDPKYMTAITPDPIGIIRGATNRKLANDFIAWMLTRDAQGLWQRKVGTPNGPTTFELRRMPIRRDMFTPAETANWTDPADPFAAAKIMPAGTPDYFRSVGPVTHAIAVDIHDELKSAWAAILANPDHPQRAKMLALFDAMPDDLMLKWPDAELESHWQEALDTPDHPRRKEVVKILADFSNGLVDRYKGEKGPDLLLNDRLRWTLFFRENYRQIVELAASKN